MGLTDDGMSGGATASDGAERRRLRPAQTAAAQNQLDPNTTYSPPGTAAPIDQYNYVPDPSVAGRLPDLRPGQVAPDRPDRLLQPERSVPNDQGHGERRGQQPRPVPHHHPDGAANLGGLQPVPASRSSRPGRTSTAPAWRPMRGVSRRATTTSPPRSRASTTCPTTSRTSGTAPTATRPRPSGRSRRRRWAGTAGSRHPAAQRVSPQLPLRLAVRRRHGGPIHLSGHASGNGSVGAGNRWRSRRGYGIPYGSGGPQQQISPNRLGCPEQRPAAGRARPRLHPRLRHLQPVQPEPGKPARARSAGDAGTVNLQLRGGWPRRPHQRVWSRRPPRSG